MLNFFTKENKEKLSRGLEKTREGFLSGLTKRIFGKGINENFLNDFEEVLISCDVGVSTTLKIIERIKKRTSKEPRVLGANENDIMNLLKDEIATLLTENGKNEISDFTIPDSIKPYVILVVGVNGVGKTTTIGKLAYQFRKQEKKVLLGAADTFRAAAIEQLKIWSERVGTEIISKGANADPSSVAFDAVKTAVEKKYDVVIIDTAGRLHTKTPLMNELSKVRRTIQKVLPDAPHEVLLVLDASTGQNAIQQAKHFTAATQVSGIALTKLDGTAKGGIVIAISDEFKIPVRYIGVGEGIEDLQIFNAKEFADSLFASR